jgi:hypothetical protein
MLDRLDEVSNEGVKTLGEIERDKLRVARAYNKEVKENVLSLRSDHQIGKDHIGSRK